MGGCEPMPVPQSSVLVLAVWSMLYDDVLGYKLTMDPITGAFAHGIVLIVEGANSGMLMANTNECFSRIGVRAQTQCGGR